MAVSIFAVVTLTIVDVHSETVQNLDAGTSEMSLIAEQGVCSGAKCGLCNQPCADACCANGTKPECCSQHVTPQYKIPYRAPYSVRETPCPACGLCKSILSQENVDPKLAKCCTTIPCGTVKTISNKVPDPPKNRVINGTNPYGPDWTYEKHVKKNGVDTRAFENATSLVKSAVAHASKDVEMIVQQMSSAASEQSALSNTSNSSQRLNTSTVPGAPVIMLPPGVTAKDWETPTNKSNATAIELMEETNEDITDIMLIDSSI